ncbi:MAG: glycoside hydrolase family 9 protein [Acidobacteriota bacterium]
MFSLARAQLARISTVLGAAMLAVVPVSAQCPESGDLPTLEEEGGVLHLDPFIEQPDLWCNTHPEGTVEVSLGEGYDPELDDGDPPPQGLQVIFHSDLGAVTNGLPSKVGALLATIELPETLDLGEYKRLRFRARIAGQRHGFIHPGWSINRNIWADGAAYGSAPLDEGDDWREISVYLDVDRLGNPIDEDGRRVFTEFALVATLVGYMPDEDPYLTVFLDDFRLDNGDDRGIGWEIPLDALRVPSSGFRPYHEKIAIGNQNLVGQTFHVFRLDVPSAIPVLSREFALVTNRIDTTENGVALADFTDIVTPGRYQIRTGSIVSPDFSIGENAYREALEDVASWVADMRCGIETRLHSACHVDDAWIDPDGPEGSSPWERLENASGGWHDAGDLRNYYFNSYQIPHELLEAHETGWDWLPGLDADFPEEPGLLTLARWGLKHALATQYDGRLLNKIDDDDDYRLNNYWSNGEPDSDGDGSPTGDDRTIQHLTEDRPEKFMDVAYLATSASVFRRLLESDPELLDLYPAEIDPIALADATLQLAQERFNDRWTCEPDELEPAQCRECRECQECRLFNPCSECEACETIGACDVCTDLMPCNLCELIPECDPCDHCSWCPATRLSTPWPRSNCNDPSYPFSWQDGNGRLISYIGRAALQLHLALDSLANEDDDVGIREAANAYLRQAADHANRVTGWQERSFVQSDRIPFTEEWVGDLSPSPRKIDDTQLFQEVPEEFLAEMYLSLPYMDCTSTAQPENPCTDAPRLCSAEWRHTLRLGAEYWMKPVRASWAPYGLSQIIVNDAEIAERDIETSVVWKERTPNVLIVPAAGYFPIAESAIALNSMARALRDPELDRLARRHVQWALGLNPSGTTYISDHVEGASPTQLYSFSQGVMPGAIAGYGLGNDGEPLGQIGAEPNVRAGALLVRAMAAVSEPARFDLTLLHDDAPFNGTLALNLLRNNELVLMDPPQIDSSGLVTLTLDGGWSYELIASLLNPDDPDADRLNPDDYVHVRVPLTAISGTHEERTIHLESVFQLTARAPKRVRSGEQFKVDLTLENRGLKTLFQPVTVETSGATTVGPSLVAMNVEAGQEETVTLTFVAEPDSNDDYEFKWKHPFLIGFSPHNSTRNLNARKEGVIDVTGVIYLEDCTDGTDNDLDGLIDYADPECTEFDCEDDLDNDQDDLVDCADSDCGSHPTCIEVDCEDLIDNDGDGRIDCADPDCGLILPETCLEQGNCNDTIDNDLDGLIDCDDIESCCLDPICEPFSGCPGNGPGPWTGGGGGGFGG